MNAPHATSAHSPRGSRTRVRGSLELLLAAAVALAVTVFVTWPHALHPTLVADHFDPYFSIWRLSHIARALGRWPPHLFDGNIFYPATNTLAYSDATLLEGLIALPLLHAHLAPSLVYNLLLLAGFVGSGIGIYVLARHVTGDMPASLVAVVVFTGLPYRIEHLMHLEMQWAMFIPLSLWAVHRTVESGHWKDGLLFGLFLWLQFLSCLYYGVFLSMTLVLFVPVLLWVKGHERWATIAPPLVGGGVLAVLLTVPYLLPYLAAAKTVGTRPVEEIARYSALPISYLATSELNHVWGWTADLWGAQELRLHPGLIAVGIALASWSHPRRRMVVLYMAITALVVELSFGTNGWLYRLLLGHISALQGFRALARFGIVVGCAVAILAALGTQAMLMNAPWSKRQRIAFGVLLVGGILLEYSNRAVPLSFGVAAKPADAYQVLRTGEPGPIVEFPLPNLENLPGFDPYYEAWSVWHWRPLLNGYSGFYPKHYQDAVKNLEHFPDEHSIETLRALNVRYVMIHRGFYNEGEYTPLALKLATTPGLKLWGLFKDPVGMTDILEVQR